MLKKPLQKIVTGGVCVAFAFVAAAILESKIQKSYAKPLMEEGEARYTVKLLPINRKV